MPRRPLSIPPRGAGSKLLAGADGLICGTTGGGLAEARAIDACARALRSGQAAELDFVMDGRLAAQAEMICGGRVRLLIEPFLPDRAPLALLRQAAQDEREGGCVALRPFPPDDGEQWSLLTADGRLLGAFPGRAGGPAPQNGSRSTDGGRENAVRRAVLSAATADHRRGRSRLPPHGHGRSAGGL